MSTDSTELTFVRCPSCRSLVPAISTRCRMCGASLDSSGKPEDQEAESRKQSRVRQRTMSQPRSELTSAAGQIRQEHVEDPVDAVSAAPESEVAADDPLGSFIQEVEENGNGGAPEAGVSHEQGQADYDDFSEDSPEEQGHSAPLETVPPREPERYDTLGGDEDAPPAARPRVVVESGSRKMGKGGLSFGKSREEKSGLVERDLADGAVQQPAEAQNWKTVDRPGGRPGAAERQPSDHRRGGASGDRFRVPEREARENVRPATQPESRQREHEAREERGSQPAARRPVEPQERRAEETRQAEAVKGRLFGWLVSYSNPDGTAIELREGRFFVSRNSLKQTDLIVDDPSVSTPHALINVGLDGKFQMQDLMSDRGVFLRRRGGDTYQREDSMEVQHGDWIRFGDVEFLVCLIAHVGAK